MNHSVSFLILSNSNKKKWNLIEDTYLYKYSIPSIIDCVNFCNSKNFNYNFKLFVGIDDDDEFLINLIDQYTLLLSHLNNVQIEFVKFNNIKKGYLTKMWNVLFKKAYHENFDYFYQMGDDIKFNYVDWIPDAINSLVSNDNIGVTGPPCTVHNIILTQSFVSRKHMDIFGFYFPEDDIVNQYCDDWINMIYFPSHRFYLRKTLTNMCVAMDRGEDRYEIVRLKVQDVVGKHQHKLLNFIENNKPTNSNGLIAEDFIVDWVLKNDGLLFTRKINNFNTTPNNKSKKLICVTGSSNLLQQLSQLIEQFDHKITLIIIETDQTPISQNLIDNPKIKHIFAWNIPFNHPKLTAIPIGINYTRHFQTLNSFLSDHTPTQPEKLVAINFSLDTNHTRRILMLKAESPPWNEFCDCLQHIPNKVSYIKDSLIEGKLNNDVTPADYYKTIQNYKFILSPPGAGLDCHRTWETLYLDRIPIVLKSPLNELYENLPVVVVDNWDVITKDFLETKYSEITENKRKNKYNMEKITITHLLNSFNTMLDLYMSKSINLVLYSQGEPFNSTKKKLIKTINNYTNRNVIIHDYDLDRIMKSSWYNKIKDLPKINGGKGRRDGYYNCWKSFIVNEVYENMNDSDILYYVDSSKYFKYGFTENVDKLCDIVLKEGIIAGSVGKDIRNNSINCCNNINIWNKIIPNNDNSEYLNKMHVLNSWFILVKNNINTNFLNDWNYWSVYKDNEFINPLVTYHHTADQSIFNILVYKYNFKVFYNKLIGHNENKDRNVVLKTINNNINSEQYLINL